MREHGTLRLSIDKAVADLGWRPRWTVHEAILRTVDWYRAWLGGERDLRARCEATLADHERA